MKGFDSQWYLRRTGIQLAAPKRKKCSVVVEETKFEKMWKQQDHFRPYPFEKEYRFHERRRYLFDFAWTNQMVALEIDGGLFLPDYVDPITGKRSRRGGHVTGVGKKRDCQKDWLATQCGWRVIRWTPDMVTSENCMRLFRILFDLTQRKIPIRFVSVAD